MCFYLLIIKGTTNIIRGSTQKEIKNMTSVLEYRLHKLKFVRLLQANQTMEALVYIRNHLIPFLPTNGKEIQQMMGAMAYPGESFDTSPYRNQMEPDCFSEISDLFVRDACAVYGMIRQSPLLVALNAGCKVVPGYNFSKIFIDIVINLFFLAL